MLKQKDKEKIVREFKTHEDDTGSPEVQVGLLTEEVRRLLLHLKKHKKDVHSKRGLLKMVAKRRQILAYLKEEDLKRHRALVRKIGVKKQ